MRYFRRFIWFFASRVLILSLALGLMLMALYLSMNASNIYVILKDGFAKRAQTVMMGAPEEDLQEAMRRIRLFLEPGGLLLFDLNTPVKFRRIDGEVYTEETEDAFCVWRAELEEKEKRCVFGMDIFLKQGKLWRREMEEHVEYVYSPEEIASLLTGAGFSPPKVFGGLPLRQMTGDEDRLFFISGRGD